MIMIKLKGSKEISDYLRQMEREGKVEYIGTIQIPMAEISLNDLSYSNGSSNPKECIEVSIDKDGNIDSANLVDP